MKVHTVAPEILKKIRHLEIHTRRLLSGTFVGDKSSAQKGVGFDFDQIRDYQLGDDIRFIDWKSSARADKILVRQYIEDRNRAIMVVVDTSSSNFFSSAHELKYEVMAQIASVLALVADYGKDAVGLVLFAQEVELFIPPAQGRIHAMHIMEKVLSFKRTQRASTSLKSALDFVARLKRKDTVVFMISDFIEENVHDNAIKLTAAAYDLVAIRCLDANERALPEVGFLEVHDIETESVCVIDARKVGHVNAVLEQRLREQKKMLNKYGVDVLDITTNQPFMGETIRFFSRRMRY